MPTIMKSVSASVSTEPGSEVEGTFSALVATFGNIDSQGDITEKGAFADSLASWSATGRPVPIIFNHNWDDPFAHIGGFDPATAEETDDGLLIKGQLDLENPQGAQVYKLMKSGRIDNFSYSATTADGGWSLSEAADGTVVQHLNKLNLIEVGPCLRGASQETRLVAIKSDRPILRGDTPSAPQNPAPAPDEVIEKALGPLTERIAALEGLLVEKQGRVLAQKHVDALTEAHHILAGVIDAAKSSPPPGGDPEPAKSAADPDPTITPRQQAKAQLAALANRKDQE